MPTVPPDEQAAPPEVIPLPDFIRALSEGLHGNANLDQDLVALLDTHLISGEITAASVSTVAAAIEQLAANRSEAENA